MKLFKLHRTRIDGLGFVEQVKGIWRVVDCHDSIPNSFGNARCVGPQYKTKAELLADFDRYANESWGY